MAASALLAERELQGITTLQELLDYLSMPDGLWTAFLQQVGGPGHNIRLVAALPMAIHGPGQHQGPDIRGQSIDGHLWKEAGTGRHHCQASLHGEGLWHQPFVGKR